ncbi:SDR family NAD(P)-dependent oxidoreductase [Aquipuribacter nitratireducens]|uniref:SDR family NAD(P)-dependent oxidoreductase n=1 Tax=Aquipuribacter nitratireducens TaxID=650104 RepID=A0ABW0GHN9_9MICO
MTTIAIVGAGAGVGAAVARRFGREGFAVALLARDQARLDTLARALTDEGITARGFAADVRDRAGLRDALAAAAAELGPVQVLQFSPIPQREFLKPLTDTTGDDLAAALDFSVLGPKTAVDAVLPGMRAAGAGTVVLVNGGTAVRPRADYAGTSVAFAAESVYAQLLHEVLAPEGIHVTQLVVPGAIREDDPQTNPTTIADVVWGLHERREGFRHFLTPMP